MGSIVGALSSFAIAFAIGIGLAINPKIYVRGLLKLIPLGLSRRRAADARRSGLTLRAWPLASCWKCC